MLNRLVAQGVKLKRPLNPFNPGQPVSPSEFVGRTAEIDELSAALNHTQNGKPRHFLITGERGVGKTSFMDYIQRRAKGNSNAADREFNFLTAHVAIHQSTTKLEIARRIRRDLNSQIALGSPLREAVRGAWDFIQRIEAAGISLQVKQREAENESVVYEDLADCLSGIVSKACVAQSSFSLVNHRPCDGILVCIDEVDQASKELDLGVFLKYLLERMSRNDCRRVCIGLSGLPEASEVLLASHPSSLRLFDELSLRNLGPAEVEELIANAELEVQNKNSQLSEFRFSRDARNEILRLSGGHPHFVHQIGYCAFEEFCKFVETGATRVELNHVLQGAFADRGAIAVIGDVYFNEHVKLLADSSPTLEALAVLSEYSVDNVGRSVLKSRLRLSDQELGGLLETLSKAGLVLYDPLNQSTRLRHSVFAYWWQYRRPRSAS